MKSRKKEWTTKTDRHVYGFCRSAVKKFIKSQRFTVGRMSVVILLFMKEVAKFFLVVRQEENIVEIIRHYGSYVNYLLREM